VRRTLKQLMVGTAAALFAAGCASTGPTSAGSAGTGPSSTASSSTASTSPGAASSSESAPASTSAAGSSSTSAPANTTAPAGQASIYGCDRMPVAQPKSYILTCGDGGVVLDQLTWSGWGTAQATATGVRIQNSCIPSCAAGSPISSKATVTLSGLSGGHYTKLRVVTAKGTSDYTIDAAGPVVTGAR